MERKLGQSSQRFMKGNDSYIKLTWDLVYDVPLISSLQQLLSDEHVLDEVNWCLYVYLFIILEISGFTWSL